MTLNDNNRNNPVNQTPVSGTPPSNHKAIYAALIAVIVILSAAVVYLAMGRNSEQPNGQQTSNTQTPTPTPNPTPNPDPTPTVKSNSYTYGNVILSYENNPKLQYPDQYVSVYITENGSKSELIKEVPIDIAGGGMPEFKKTSKPSIALLTTSFGDMGAFFNRSYYIDIPTKKVLSVNNTNGPTLEITDINKVVSKVQLSITDNCGTGQNRKSGVAAATLKDLTVNGKSQNVVAQSRTLTCTGPLELGPAYEPDPNFDYTGISSDLAKVYFKVNGSSYKNGQEQILWKNDYSFDIKTKTIKEEKPANIL